MSRQVWKGSTLLNPEPPVLVSCGSPEKPNLITVGWCGTICTQPPMLSISVRPERYSHKLIKESGEFVVNLPTESLVKAIDWCGVKSGRDVDKFAAMHLTAAPAAKLGTVLLEESPVGMLHLQVEERPIALSLRICISEIQPVEDICGIDKAKALPADIAEISLGEVIFQSGRHLACRVALVEVERPHSLQVSSDLRNPELCLAEADAVHFLQVSQQSVGTAVHAFPADPNEGAVTQIIAFHPTVHQHRVVVVADHRVQRFLHLKTGNVFFTLTQSIIVR